MSVRLWKEMPEGFLKIGFKAFDKLDHDIKQLIFDLAKDQNFKCALCSKRRDLIIEHEHEPREKVPCTVYNIRGLVCGRCNKALMGCDMEECGYFTNWENGYPYLSSDDYQNYKYRFDCRVAPLIDAAHVKRVGCRNTAHREHVLWMLDARYEEGRFPWQRRSKGTWDGEIRSPEQAIEVLTACVEFVAEQFKKDPNYEPPEIFLKLMVQIRPILDQAMADREHATADNTAAHVSNNS
jgi:recombination endonuclease VII